VRQWPLKFDGLSRTTPHPAPCFNKWCHASVALQDDGVQHLRPDQAKALEMDPPEAASARLFLCARCRVQVLLCSRCDRGQRYCSRVCSGLSRRAARHEAAARYQRSRGGRLAHAARSRHWRQRQRSQNVTHQGSLRVAADAPLPTWSTTPALPSPAPTEALTDPPRPPPGWTCRRCRAVLSSWVRLGWLRHAPPPGARHDHSP